MRKQSENGSQEEECSGRTIAVVLGAAIIVDGAVSATAAATDSLCFLDALMTLSKWSA